MSERWIRAALASVVDAGDPRMSETLAANGPEEIWQQVQAGALSEAWQRRARVVSPQQLEEEAHHLGLRVIVPGDDEWPDKLDHLNECPRVGDMGGAPVALWLKGRGHLSQLAARSVAIVGARACTKYGKLVARTFAQGLGDAGYVVVSGGAYGIDAAAHQGALLSSGVTVAVAAGGLDIPYPTIHEHLFDEICQQGVQISETRPGIRPMRHAFLARNRLIAALSEATIIVEAALRSGAKNTTSWADALSRQVLAVPGPVTSSESETPNYLIRDHCAQAVTSVTDVVSMLSPVGTVEEQSTTGPGRPLDFLSAAQSRVRECLPATGGMTLDNIAIASGLSVRECAVVLTELEELARVTLVGPLTWRAS